MVDIKLEINGHPIAVESLSELYTTVCAVGTDAKGTWMEPQTVQELEEAIASYKYVYVHFVRKRDGTHGRYRILSVTGYREYPKKGVLVTGNFKVEDEETGEMVEGYRSFYMHNLIGVCVYKGDDEATEAFLEVLAL